MRKSVIAVVGVLGLGALALAGCSSDDNSTTSSESSESSESGDSGESEEDWGPITIATLPTEDGAEANPVEALAELLGEASGREVEVTDVPDYLSVVEAIRAGHQDIGVMSGFPTALAVNTGEVDALIAFKGSDDPVSMCIVMNDSDAQTLEDLAGKSVGFADPGSSSGYFMPVYMLDQAGLTMNEDYDAVITGSHQNSYIALENGEIDAACTTALGPDLGPDFWTLEEGTWRSVGESQGMPISGSILGRTDFSDAERESLQEALIATFDESNADALGTYSLFAESEKIVDPDDSEFQFYVDIAAVAGVDLEDLE